MRERLRELSLFSGAGGGLLATRWLLGWSAVGYVEWNDYCQRVLRARIDDGLLDEAPIFGDVRAFLSEGYAERYRGVADVISAGFPCQPFSVAGARRADEDERNMWPATAECIRVVRPRFCLLENVPGLLAHRYFDTVLGDLAALGYGVRWTVLGADDVGAPHRRKRLWILADAADDGLSQRCATRGVHARQEFSLQKQPGGRRSSGAAGCGAVAHPAQYGREPRREGDREEGARGRQPHRGGVSEDGLADSFGEGQLQPEGSEREERRRAGDGCSEVDNAERQRLEASREPRDCRHADLRVGPECAGHVQATAVSSGGSWWRRDPAEDPESGVGRVAHGVAHRVDRLRALGNGQVSLVAAAAWRLLGGP